MRSSYFYLFFIVFGLGLFNSCHRGGSSNSSKAETGTVVDVNATYFTTANPNTVIKKVPCTLSDGSETDCYEIITKSIPVDHQMGPWCPDNISDDASAGGIWLEEGKVYDVDGDFIKNLATFYNDETWQMYDANGDVYITKTEEDCINAANPNVGEAYENFCVECLPSFIHNVSQTFLIPVSPVLQTDASYFSRGPGPGGPGGPDGGKGPRGPEGQRPPKGEGGRNRPDGPGRPEDRGGQMNAVPSTRGLALNGIEFSAPAPVDNILSAYTLAPFDNAGGHINVHQGYHYHAATGVSFSIEQSDGHAALIGYAMDGLGIYSHLDAEGNEAEDLDDCRGHYDEVRGYHYHVDAAGNNNFINCLQGAYVK
ncbi:YHYH protein [Membranihabitans marinus]|uniref:YHYH protein n=1 Tax=Membranihabitans marinus TaxID=1227546 RepID=UPI001F341F94|nr:YHYH protein [Membranihabitans marinus]